ncbi:hypothetical protein NQ315_000491 [Exocentrus adspersus]|uniref:Peptidase aspartic putative domain-containing protein n=1 Tax=Exocentrus adspersus TaxID=1586481 RepID=A0AAV8VF63_9CUCU|nr:hypothetical protein NQ315_000491 [Exocentrus adspersus]
MFAKHLDEETLTRYQLEELLGDDDVPTYQSLFNFVYKQFDAQDTTKLSLHSKLHNSTNNRCSSLHGKTPQERFNFAKENKLCLNCLSSQHTTKTCKSSTNYRKCNSRHHTLLHFSRESYALNTSKVTSDCPEPTGNKNLEETPSTATTSNATNFCGIVSTTTNVLLSTAVMDIQDIRGNYQRVRVLLDYGSQTSYISQKCFNRLGLTRFNCSLSIQGLSSMKETTAHGAVSCVIKPVGKSLPKISVEAVILRKLCADMPTSKIDNTNWSHISNINLADPQFYQPSAVDLLLGADVFADILQQGRLVGNSEEPIAVNTVFGWILMGKYQVRATPFNHTTSLYSFASDNDLLSLNNNIKRFWKLEEVPSAILVSPDDEICEQFYNKTHSRTPSGRYIVELPFIDSMPYFDCDNSRPLALRRFLSLERRLLKTPDIYKKYSDIFSLTDVVQDFRLKRVPFGLRCSPYLANRTIIQVAKDEGAKYPLAADILQQDIYIDDIVTGCNSLQEAKLLRDQLIALLKLEGFELRKWACNVPDFLSDLPGSDRQLQMFALDASTTEALKILGLQWRPFSDDFSYKIETFNSNCCTKRSILSDIARIFDPLGFLAPVTFFAKHFIQHLWSLGLDWDTEIPKPLQDKWLIYKSELNLLSNFSLPRHNIIRVATVYIKQGVLKRPLVKLCPLPSVSPLLS